jgi:hypothetical protein
MDLIIDRLTMHETPQSGTWLFCFMATAGSASGTYHIPDKEYSGDGINIDMGLRLNNVSAGQTCYFRCNLDDDEADVCGDSAEDRSSGSFTANSPGSQSYNPQDDWSYTIYWHME